MILKKGVLYDALRPLSQLASRLVSPELRDLVRLVGDDSRLVLVSTDSSSWLRVSMPCDGAFSGCMPAKTLIDFLKPADRADRDGVVELKAVEHGHVVVAIEGAMITLAALSAENYPKSPVVSGSRLKKLKSWCVPDFRDALSWVLLAVGLDDSRRALTGVLFDLDCVVAVDGHRLHRAQLGGFGWPTLVAGSAVAALLSVLPKTGVVELYRAGDALLFRAGRWELATKPMDEQFPPYAQVIPSESSERFRAVVEGPRVRAALRRFSRSALVPANGLQVKVNGAIEIGATSDRGVSCTTVPVISTTHAGPDFCMGLNAGYLRDAIAGGEHEIDLRFAGEIDPVVVRPAEDRLAVIMPVRL